MAHIRASTEQRKLTAVGSPEMEMKSEVVVTGRIQREIKIKTECGSGFYLILNGNVKQSEMTFNF